MMYKLLTEDQQDDLRKERLFALEADHFRFSLLVEEDSTNQDAHLKMLELRDRIMHHHHILEMPPKAQETQEG